MDDILDPKDELDENVDPLKTPILDVDEDEVVDPAGVPDVVSIDDLVDEEEEEDDDVMDDQEADEM